jgi:hypothetical protein
MEISFKQTIFSLEPKNKKCNDCGDDDVKYVSVNNGITLCELCAQIHKNFGNQISFLRSIDEEFDDYLMNYFIYGGNKKFRKTLRHMGVNLDVKKAQLYKTYGVDYYRRNLKSIVKGNSQLEKDFDNPNEVMQINSNAFPEFENYTLNTYNANANQNLSLLNNLEINLDSNAAGTYTSNVINNPIDNQNNDNNNIKISQEKMESVKNEPDEQKSEENGGNNGAPGQDDNMEKVKKVMNYSLKNMKKFGNFMKKEGIKGFGVMKKYGNVIANKSKPIIQNSTNYVNNHVPYFNQNKGQGAQNEEKEDDKAHSFIIF